MKPNVERWTAFTEQERAQVSIGLVSHLMLEVFGGMGMDPAPRETVVKTAAVVGEMVGDICASMDQTPDASFVALVDQMKAQAADA